MKRRRRTWGIWIDVHGESHGVLIIRIKQTIRANNECATGCVSGIGRTIGGGRDSVTRSVKAESYHWRSCYAIERRTKLVGRREVIHQRQGLKLLITRVGDNQLVADIKSAIRLQRTNAGS